MKRLLISFALLITAIMPSLVIVPAAHAFDLFPACKNTQSSVCPTDTNENVLFGPHGVLTTAVNILSIIAGLVAVFVIMIAGVKMITSAGDPTSISSAKKAILYAVISLVVVASAQLIVRFIINKVG
ncbi:MAG TPA: pilin [Patescibacteria group bacterium]|nr:pilin [Patescibacteria group bacterium]